MIIAIILCAMCLFACNNNDTDTTNSSNNTDTSNDSNITDNVPPITENYTNVDALLENDKITSITKDNYALLSSMDLSKLPESVAGIYREILEDIITYQVLYTVDDKYIDIMLASAIKC